MTTQSAAEATQPAASAAGGKRITGYQTVLTDPTNYHVKHPLQSRWTLTQKMGQVENASSRGVSTKEWEAGLVANVSIGTVEDFWWYEGAWESSPSRQVWRQRKMRTPAGRTS